MSLHMWGWGRGKAAVTRSRCSNAAERIAMVHWAGTLGSMEAENTKRFPLGSLSRYWFPAATLPSSSQLAGPALFCPALSPPSDG